MARIYSIMDEFDERARDSIREDEDYLLEKAFKEGCEHGYKKAMREAGLEDRSIHHHKGSYREGFEEKIEKLKEKYK